jgi:flagellar basal-body rod protein FlgF
MKLPHVLLPRRRILPRRALTKTCGGGGALARRAGSRQILPEGGRTPRAVTAGMAGTPLAITPPDRIGHSGMDSPGYIVLSRLVAAQRATAVAAHNIANADTPGFRTHRPVFGTVLERQSRVDAPRGGRDLAFAQDRATWREKTAAPLVRTGNPLDMALANQDAFFAVQTAAGERYTRAGRFTLDPERRVVDADGNAVLGAAGRPLQIEPGAMRIDVLADGTIATENGPAGQLRVVRFEDEQRLRAEGDRNYMAPPEMEPEPVAQPGVVQGATEGSNVRPILELTRLTEDMRQFQFVTQMAEREGERLGSAVERILRRR